MLNYRKLFTAPAHFSSFSVYKLLCIHKHKTSELRRRRTMKAIKGYVWRWQEEEEEGKFWTKNWPERDSKIFENLNCGPVLCVFGWIGERENNFIGQWHGRKKLKRRRCGWRKRVEEWDFENVIAAAFCFDGVKELNKSLEYEGHASTESDFLHKFIFELLTWLDSTYCCCCCCWCCHYPPDFASLSHSFWIQHFKLNKIQEINVAF